MADSVGGRKQGLLGAGTEQGTRESGARSSEMSLYKSSAEEAVRGKASKASSVYKSSGEYFEYSCDPCNTTGENMEAQGFCKVCEEYLCGTCFKSHSRGKATRHHTLLDKDNMPRRHGQTCDPCKTADEDKDAEGYCASCEEYLCSDCFKSHSKSKATRSHTLMDKDSMPGAPSNLTASVSKINICKESSDYQKGNETYTYVKDVSVKEENDEDDCFITDMVLVSMLDLVLVDCKNKSLKHVDIENNVLKDTLRLQTPPCKITAMSEDQVAVTLATSRQIKVIAISGGLSVVRTFKTDGYCADISYIKGKLYVSFGDPVKFQILEPTGEIYKTVKPTAEVLKHCTNPRYIAVSPDKSMIYISDWTTNKVMCTDMNWRLISMYQGELYKPQHITISPFGSVYLCNRKQHIVYKMTSDLSDVTEILGRGDGMEYPQAVCFNADKQHLYISSASNASKYRNFIKVYKWI